MGMFRKGDIVLIEAAVRYDQTETDRVFIEAYGGSFVMDPADVQLIRPFFKAHDVGYIRSATGGSGYKAVTVLGTHDNLVWVEDEDGGTEVVEALDVLREMPGTVTRGDSLDAESRS